MNKIIKIIPSTQLSESFINIAPASDFIPDWYRKSPSTINNNNSFLLPDNPAATSSTYKKCSPFYDALSSGYIMYLSSDIEVIYKNDTPHILWRTNDTLVTEHSNNQWEGLPVPEGYFPFVYKWNNELILKSPKDYSLLFLNPINRFDLPFQVISGIVDCDAYELSTHFPFFIKKGFTGIIEKGTPIVQIIPIKRDSWVRQVEKYNKKEISVQLKKYFSTIKRSYKNNYWFRKEYK
jgi:hypothetical protein